MLRLPAASKKPHPALEHLEDRLTPAQIDPILEWNAVAIKVNRVSYSGGARGVCQRRSSGKGGEPG